MDGKTSVVAEELAKADLHILERPRKSHKLEQQGVLGPR